MTDIVEELDRSIVAKSLYPIDIDLMEAKLRGTFLPFDAIRAMGAYKALITFPSKEERDETIKEGGNVLSEYFDELRIWSKEEVYQK